MSGLIDSVSSKPWRPRLIDVACVEGGHQTRSGVHHRALLARSLAAFMSGKDSLESSVVVDIRATRLIVTAISPLYTAPCGVIRPGHVTCNTADVMHDVR